MIGSALRIVCDACSRGNPGLHNCSAEKFEDGTRSFGVAAIHYEGAVRALWEWTEVSEGARFTELRTELDAPVQ